MSIATPPTAMPPSERVKKRVYIPVILLTLVVLVGIGFYVRGTWADTRERNPAGPETGTVTQLLERPNHNVVVRCAVVVDAPPKDVWAVINDYGTHHEFLPYVAKVEATPQKDGKIFIDGIAQSRLWGEWPFESFVTNTTSAEDGDYSATWDEVDKGEFNVNRGGWKLKRFDPAGKQTLLEFSLQIEVKKCPHFLVRNIIMDRLHSVLKAMRDETLRRKKA
ncbi:MAG TPA: SRPBCC family protein [Gemmataceae bacterium]|nr:SRPBCC family protein [Gemmataceae bacterium]